MGKSILSQTKFKQLSRILSSDRIRPPSPKHPNPNTRLILPPPQLPKALRVDSPNPTLRMEETSSSSSSEKKQTRIPLADMVADCAKRWFQDTLTEAKAGDVSMQVLVGQMYCSGYGVPIDAQKGRAWINKASRVRGSVWKAGDKPPGFNASESDSDDSKATLNQD